MSWTLAQTIAGAYLTSAGSSVAPSLGSPVTAGNLLIVYIDNYGSSSTPATFTVADSKSGNTYTLAKSGNYLPSNACTQAIYYSVIASGGSGFQVTVTSSDTSSLITAAIEEWSCTSGLVPGVESVSYASGYSFTPTSGVLTFTAGDLLVGITDNYNAKLASAGTNFALSYNQTNASGIECATENYPNAPSSPLAVTFGTFTNGEMAVKGDYGCVGVAFKASLPGGAVGGLAVSGSAGSDLAGPAPATSAIAVAGAYGTDGASLIGPLLGFQVAGAWGSQLAGPWPAASGLSVAGLLGSQLSGPMPPGAGMQVAGAFGGDVAGPKAAAAGPSVAGYAGGDVAGPIPAVPGIQVSDGYGVFGYLLGGQFAFSTGGLPVTSSLGGSAELISFGAAGWSIAEAYGGAGETVIISPAGLAVAGAYGGDVASASPAAAGLPISDGYGVFGLTVGGFCTVTVAGLPVTGVLGTPSEFVGFGAAAQQVSGAYGATAEPLATSTAGLAISGAIGAGASLILAAAPGLVVSGIYGTPGYVVGGQANYAAAGLPVSGAAGGSAYPFTIGVAGQLATGASGATAEMSQAVVAGIAVSGITGGSGGQLFVASLAGVQISGAPGTYSLSLSGSYQFVAPGMTVTGAAGSETWLTSQGVAGLSIAGTPAGIAAGSALTIPGILVGVAPGTWVGVVAVATAGLNASGVTAGGELAGPGPLATGLPVSDSYGSLQYASGGQQTCIAAGLAVGGSAGGQTDLLSAAASGLVVSGSAGADVNGVLFSAAGLAISGASGSGPYAISYTFAAAGQPVTGAASGDLAGPAFQAAALAVSGIYGGDLAGPVAAAAGQTVSGAGGLSTGVPALAAVGLAVSWVSGGDLAGPIPSVSGMQINQASAQLQYLIGGQFAFSTAGMLLDSEAGSTGESIGFGAAGFLASGAAGSQTCGPVAAVFGLQVVGGYGGAGETLIILSPVGLAIVATVGSELAGPAPAAMGLPASGAPGEADASHAYTYTAAAPMIGSATAAFGLLITQPFCDPFLSTSTLT